LPPKRSTWVPVGVAALAAIIAFAPALRNGLLLWDDALYITNNVGIQTLSWGTIPWAFTTFYADYWAPLTWLSLAVDHAIWGLDPVGYHLTNVLLHALNTAFVYLIARDLLRRRLDASGEAGGPTSGAVVFGAVAAAVLWSVHPLRVESVAWAAERKDVLSVAFGLAAVVAYLRYVDTPEGRVTGAAPWSFLRAAPYRWMLALYALSLLSKAMFVSLPVVLLVLDEFPLGRLRRGSVGTPLREKAPLLLLALVATAITATAMAPSSVPFADLTLSSRLLIALKGIVSYLRLTLLPTPISPVYYHPWNVTLTATYAAAALLVAALSALCLLAARRHPAPLAAWVVFLLGLAPVLGIFQSAMAEIAPRFTYFPSIPLAVLVGAGLARLWGRVGGSPRRAALVGGTALVAAALVAVTWRDIGHWRSDLRLWSRVIEVQPHAFGTPYSLRAGYLSLAGRFGEALPDALEALAIAERKGFAGVHENHAQVAGIYRALGDLPSALAAIDRALQTAPPERRGTYLAERASIFEAAGRPEEAARDRQEAARASAGAR
jgi:tetratricopeptide (TPR) repeat protein